MVGWTIWAMGRFNLLLGGQMTTRLSCYLPPWGLTFSHLLSDISCHVRTLGDWTKRLHSFFDSNPNEPTQEYRLQKDGKKRFMPNKVRFAKENRYSSSDFVDIETGQYSSVMQVNGIPHVTDASDAAAKKNPLPTGLSALMEEEKDPFGGDSAEDSDTALTTKSPLMKGSSKDAASKRKILVEMSVRKVQFSYLLSTLRIFL